MTLLLLGAAGWRNLVSFWSIHFCAFYYFN